MVQRSREEIDTTEVPAASRTQRWQEFTSRTMVRLSCSTLGATGIVGRQVNVRRSEHVSVLIEGQPHLIQRSVPDIARSPTGMAQVSFVDRG
ncbi:hypothetical protein [Citricoccus sp. GCM10030269]|uniref:hypothetical protein n=1 Tax=Citricoccus sp. GCM10030269 TaxID=3273388 RepID=UPI003618C10A